MDEEPRSEENIRLDYEQTNEYFRMLSDIRFKLLGLVPTVTGVAVSLLSGNPNYYTTLTVGIMGVLITVGIVMYELRNTQFYNAAVHRAKWLEVSLGMNLLTKNRKVGVSSTRGQIENWSCSDSCRSGTILVWL